MSPFASRGQDHNKNNSSSKGSNTTAHSWLMAAIGRKVVPQNKRHDDGDNQQQEHKQQDHATHVSRATSGTSEEVCGDIVTGRSNIISWERDTAATHARAHAQQENDNVSKKRIWRESSTHNDDDDDHHHHDHDDDDDQ